MNFFNLKAVGDKIAAPFIKKYDSILNKIAIKSKAYKQLYNEYNYFLIVHRHIKEIVNTINTASIRKLLRLLFKNMPGCIGALNSFDTDIIRMTEPNDVLIVSDDLEKHKVLEEMKHFSGSGQVFTIEDLMKPTQKINSPIGRVYVFSSIWLKDIVTIDNLVYIIEKEKENVVL